VSNIILPSSPQERAATLKALKEISNSKTRIAAEQDHIKTIVDDISTTIDVPKKYINKIAAIYHKQNLNDVSAEMEDIEALYNTVVGGESE